MKSDYRRSYMNRFALYGEQAPGGIVVYYADGDEEIIHVNKYVIDLFECDGLDDFLDYTQGSFHNFVCHDDIGVAEDSIWGQVGEQDGFDHIYYRIKTKRGRYVSVDDYGRLVEGTELGRPIFVVFIAEVKRGGSIDWLTGLPDMQRFHDLARMGAAAIAERGEQPVAVACDLMGMKTFNTRFGREEGNKLLRSFADALRAQFGNEACSRFAEDHFYALAPQGTVGEKVEALVRNTSYNGTKRSLPVRIGLYACDSEDDIVAVGFDRAKIACDLDRTTWKSHAAWFTDDMRDAARMRLYVLENIDTAIRERWIRPYYQAIVRSCTSDVCGEEALARWDDPEHGFLSPAQFIPVLEEAGLLLKLDLHMVDCVLEDFRAKERAGITVVPVSINVSLRDLGELNIAEEITRRVDAAGIGHDLLRIEFTESAASSDPALFARQLDSLHAAGFKVWMDDFGSGYSSLNVLENYDFDLIKLDMGLVQGHHPKKSRVIVEGVIRAAGRLGVDTLAEGVETEEQARYLEASGCDMLQGYYFARPASLEQVLERATGEDGLHAQDIAEEEYWRTVSTLDLSDFSKDKAPLTSLSELPVGIVERRDGTWRLLRANHAYRVFLDVAGLLPLGSSTLVANEVADVFDRDVEAAIDACPRSDTWEKVFGRLEYDTGFQFHARPVAMLEDAQTYSIVATPTTLGSSLGAYGDVPVAYAVFRTTLNEAGDAVVGAEYVYANELYLKWGGLDHDYTGLAGLPFLEVSRDAGPTWFPYFYRAAVRGESIHDVIYSEEAGHWLSFNLAPSPMEGCCVYAFTIADEERREREEIIVGRDTSDLIIRIANAFNAQMDYDTAMNNLLATMSTIIQADRLYVYERAEQTTSNTFEWCASGVRPQIDTLQQIDNAEFGYWDQLMARDSMVMIPDVAKIKDVDFQLYRQLSRQGIERVLAVPLYNDGRLIGYVCADNYVLDEGLDTRRLLETLASFVATRMVIHGLMEELERQGTVDSLTGLLNRRGIDLAIDNALDGDATTAYALALMDIDDFKTVNDLYGHDVGDEALRTLARKVVESLPKEAVVGRNGGDEFLVLLVGPESSRIEEYLSNFLSTDLGCQYNGRHYPVGMSIGYAMVPEQAEDLQSAYTKADAALYAVKLAGKSGLARYSPTMATQYRSQLGFTPRDIAENVPGAIVVHEPGDAQILFANDELVELFECDDLADFMDYTGGTFGGIIHPDDRKRVEEELAAQMHLGQAGAKDFVNYRIVTKRGNVRNVADNGRQVRIDGRGPVFYELIINRDERGDR